MLATGLETLDLGADQPLSSGNILRPTAEKRHRGPQARNGDGLHCHWTESRPGLQSTHASPFRMHHPCYATLAIYAIPIFFHATAQCRHQRGVMAKTCSYVIAELVHATMWSSVLLPWPLPIAQLPRQYLT
jgi:hypothetical protein